MTAKDLKASILQLAIQGKLVPQYPNDEPAEALLERIRGGLPAALTQRTQRAQRGAKTVGADVLGRPQSSESGKRENEEREANTKNSLRSSANFAFSASAPAGENSVNPVKKYPPVTDEEKPFDIPANWTWCRLGDVIGVYNGDRGANYPSKDKLHTSGEIPFISALNMEAGTVPVDSRLLYLSQQQYDLLRSGKLVKGDLVVCVRGSLGKHCIYPFEKGAIASSLTILRSPLTQIYSYIRVYLDSELFASEIKRFDNGTAQPNLAAGDLKKFVFPLPPLAEQKRIVAKIEELMPLVERYAAAKAASDELEANLPDAFRKSVLQQAVEGKLVPQDPNDEPAGALLERIRGGLPAALTQRTQRAQRGAKNSDKKYPPITDENSDRINKINRIEEGEASSKDSLRSSANFAFSASAPAGKNPVNPVNPVKKYPPVTDDEKPFDLPANWTWCRLGEIVFNHGQKTPESKFSYIDIGSIDNKHQRLNDHETLLMPKEASSRARKIVKKGDVIYSCVRPYLHNMAIIDRDFSREPIASTGFAVMATTDAIETKYLFYYLLSPVFDDYANDTDNAKGVAYPAISDAKLYKAVIPLPPLAEQKRIVAEVERLLALGEKLRV